MASVNYQAQIDQILKMGQKCLAELKVAAEDSVLEGMNLMAQDAKFLITTLDWTDSKGNQRYGHVDTGDLRRAIRGEMISVNKRVYGNLVTGPEVPYAAFVEALPDGGFLYRTFYQDLDIVMKLIVASMGEVLI